MQQDELARLFSANLTLSPSPAYQDVAQQQQQQQHHQHQQEQEQPSQPQPITYASTHYTHSHHVVHTPQSQSAPTTTNLTAIDLESILLRNDINPNQLFPSQINLFQNADDDQRLRLLELWRISPPQGRQGMPDGLDYNLSRQLYDWPPTSLAQEEAMAKLRYERMMEEKVQQEEIARHQHELDQSMDTGAGDSAATIAAREVLSPSHDVEPYILSGYDMLARREYEESALSESRKYNQATDPVYAGNGGIWHKTVGGIQDMENQYGAYEAARFYDAQPNYHEVEMVL